MIYGSLLTLSISILTESKYFHVQNDNKIVLIQFITLKNRISAKCQMPSDFVPALLGPELIFVTGVVTFVNAVARLICSDLLG